MKKIMKIFSIIFAVLLVAEPVLLEARGGRGGGGRGGRGGGGRGGMRAGGRGGAHRGGGRRGGGRRGGARRGGAHRGGGRRAGGRRDGGRRGSRHDGFGNGGVNGGGDWWGPGVVGVDLGGGDWWGPGLVSGGYGLAPEGPVVVTAAPEEPTYVEVPQPVGIPVARYGVPSETYAMEAMTPAEEPQKPEQPSEPYIDPENLSAINKRLQKLYAQDPRLKEAIATMARLHPKEFTIMLTNPLGQAVMLGSLTKNPKQREHFINKMADEADQKAAQETFKMFLGASGRR